MKTTYGVINKKTGLYFCGFDKGNVVWGPKESAYAMSHLEAKGQAALFACHGDDVQRKPASL